MLGGCGGWAARLQRMLSDLIILVGETKLLTVFTLSRNAGNIVSSPTTSGFRGVKSLHSFLASIFALSCSAVNGAALFADFGMGTAEECKPRLYLYENHKVNKVSFETFGQYIHLNYALI